ncbi:MULTISPECIES: porin [unclassified Paraburkholderia]|uniref:porin n=1 Tax=unclassified Paraburkholderia TaxID=2615204 RepID=UPI002AB0775D|nr:MULTISPECIES: porin [unclassified Paraburkholderia]
MKKWLVSLLCGAGSVAAHAQSSVTLYGTVDEGLQYLTHSSSGGHAEVGLQSGNAIPSLFGIKGQEDLGSGRKAYFDLESGYVVNTGQQADSSSLFNRYAFVGLEDPTWGSVELGRQWNLMFQALLDFDATSMAQYSLLSTDLFPAQSDWPSNAIKYRSPVIAGFSASAEYSFGQQVAGDSRAGRYMGASLAYDRGPLSMRAIYEDTRGELDTTTGISEANRVERRATVAAKYRFDSLSLMGGYANISGDLGLSPAGNLYWAGMTYTLTPKVTVLGEAIHHDMFHGRGEPTWVVIGGQYNLSPRTFLYGFAGYLDNHGANTVSLNALDSTQPYGMSQTGVQIGINHSF